MQMLNTHLTFCILKKTPYVKTCSLKDTRVNQVI